MSTRILAAAIAVLLVGTVAAAQPNPPCAPTGDTVNITRADGTTAAVGGENVIWVFPTGKTPDDCGHIQWAVSHVASGGIVSLRQYKKGTSDPTSFNLGDPSDTTKLPLHVSICQDVTIEGEFTEREDVSNVVGHRVGVKEDKGATVFGGQQTFYVGGSCVDDEGNAFFSKPGVSIKNIRFDGAAPGPIKFNGGSGHNEVSGCSIVNYKFGATVGGGIWGAFPLVADPGDEAGPEGLTGKFLMTDNYIGAPQLRQNLNNMTHISNADLDLTISGNVIADAYWAAIVVFGNIGTTTISHNLISKASSRTVDGAAIAVGLSNPRFFSAYAYDGSTFITENRISVSSYNSSGILLLRYPSSQYDPSVTVPQDLEFVVSANVITIERDQAADSDNVKAALACIGACSNTLWKGNTVNGSAAHGILVTNQVPIFAEPLEAGAAPSNNRFTANDLTGFTALQSQVFVDEFANENRFTNNDYGAVALDAKAGAWIQGDSNGLTNENFHGEYPGKRGSPSLPIVLFDYQAGPDGYASENNRVTALKAGRALNNSETCNQVKDENWEANMTTTNEVPGSSGWPNCNP
jgi:hypothetical protein